MKISVIMANYNGEQYIREAINSVVNQDYADYEFIIVDDASTDKSREIIDELFYENKTLIKKIYMSENKGQAECINQGAENIRGNVVCFIDSDDYWLSGKLQSVEDAFSRKQQVSLYQHNLFIMRNNEVTKEKIRDVLIDGDYFSYVKETHTFPIFVPTTGIAVNTDCLKKVLPIPAEFRICADGYLTRTCFCWGNVVSNSDCYGVYRIHSNNNTFENKSFNKSKHIKELLHPALDSYYLQNGFDVSFTYNGSFIDKVLDATLRKALKQYFKITV